MPQQLLAFCLMLFLVGCGLTEHPTSEVSSLKSKDTESVGSVDTVAKMAIPASDVPVVTSYPVPDEINLSENLPDDWCPGQYGCLQNIFRPIGWSKDARYFAYALEPAMEARDGYTLSIFVQDAALDSIVWQWTYDDEREHSSQNQGGFSSIEAVWRSDRYDELSDQLRKYTIVPFDAHPKLSPFPITVGDSVYQVVREDDYYDNPNFGVRQITRETFWVKRNDNNEKRVYMADYEEYSLLLRSAAIGALVAPNQTRMLLINVYEKRGWEGPPNVLCARLIGCRLENF